MIHLTKPDVTWLKRLLDITQWIHEEYPELFTEEDEDTLKVSTQLIEDLDK